MYEDVGITMEIVPTIYNNDEIGLNITGTVSSVSSTSAEGVPTISKRDFVTSRRIKSGWTAIIGGLMKKEQRHSSDRIPILGHLPLIGILFGNTRSDEIESEIVILITPNVLPDNGTVLKMIRDTRSPDQIKNKGDKKKNEKED